LIDGESSGTYCLHHEEDEHANAGPDEERPPSSAIAKQTSSDSPSKIPDLKDTINEELNGGVGDTNGIEDSMEIVRNQTIATPLYGSPILDDT